MWFTVRTTMVAVAVSCLILGAAKMGRRTAYWWGRSEFFAEYADDCRARVADGESRLAPGKIEEEYAALSWELVRSARRQIAWDVARHRREAVHADDQKRRWLRAAFRPWRAVPADLPRCPDLGCTFGMKEQDIVRIMGGPVPH